MYRRLWYCGKWVAIVAITLWAHDVRASEEDGYRFSLSLSATDPGVHVDEQVLGGVRDVHLWLLCADRGISALEAMVSGHVTVLGFSPASGALNAGSSTHLLLAIGGCPSTEVVLGSWYVWDDGISMCLGLGVGDDVVGVSCSPEVGSTEVRVQGVVTGAVEFCDIGVGCITAGVAIDPQSWASVKQQYR